MIVATDKAISIPDAAQRLGVSTRTIRRMIELHEIHAFKVLGQWRIRESEIERIMRGNESESQAEDTEE
ncbi:helix-turn-helix domain-containing protein [Ktedonobacter racemifer]|uniref:DNA binding domain protein, excisionase family n=1 Tax=Ktedonobacter racemifer DSM 44963 TaxID=485913 RepID=D6U8Z5_KTERA|nr:helix-turn-helix domain-containing protein [Ktedonobacter racemifer]EFH79550.1 DNA binding domain protein, excisionase family [Ktedonobacter racemifer DSM 44963]